jgi:hypothetical protein
MDSDLETTDVCPQETDKEENLKEEIDTIFQEQ